jgi:hypothetical protein
MKVIDPTTAHVRWRMTLTEYARWTYLSTMLA